MINRNIHGAFNARTLSVADLCNSFIINESYEKLVAPSHAILVGPRGSGKTTLMRMMQVDSLNFWEGEEASEYRNNMNYSSVFIPTDKFWKTQFDKLRESLRDKTEAEALLKVIFIYHILERFCSVVEYRVNHAKKTEFKYRSSQLSKSDETELVAELSHLWELSPAMLTLRSLETSIARKKSQISSSILMLINGSEGEVPTVVRDDIVSLIDSSVRIVNSYLGEKGEKWVFLFDELELAPEEIIQPLVDAMRGGPEDIIFKLSLSPYHKDVVVTTSPESSMGGQDHYVVRLTGADEDQGLNFAEQICASVFRKNGYFEDVRTYFEEPKKMDVHKVFTELQEKDSSFKEYLSSKGIDVESLESYTEKDKLPTIRKIKFVAQVRNYYFKKQRKRPSDFYVGFDNLCKAMEFNPRMLIGLMNMLVSHLAHSEKIRLHDQVASLMRMFESYKSLLNTISINDRDLNVSTIYEFIDAIGRGFKLNTLGEVFKPEPKGSLLFGRKENIAFENVIGLALNSGALVLDDSKASVYYNNVDISESRCRLSFIFAHHFSLLTTKQREQDLFNVIDFDQYVVKKEQSKHASDSAPLSLSDRKTTSRKKKNLNTPDSNLGGQMELL